MAEKRRLRGEAERQRDAAILKCAKDGKTPVEIAEATGIPRSVVRYVMYKNGLKTSRRSGALALLPD
jgi:hypothetical protein